MENKKQILIIVLAIAAGVIATIMVAKHIERNINDQTTKLAKNFALEQKKREETFRSEMASLYTKLDNVESKQKEIAQKAIEAAKKAAEAQKAKAEDKKKKRKPSLALRTPQGKRALTIQLNSLGAVGGLVNPGDFVDVIAHLNIPQVSTDEQIKTSSQPLTVMIFQNIQILAIDTNLNEPGAYDDQQAAPTLKLTFAVDPEEAGLLSFAEKNGNLELALRSPKEKQRYLVKTSTWDTLAEYVLENYGAEITLPEEDEEIEEDLDIEEVDVEEAKPYIQIFRGGKEL